MLSRSMEDVHQCWDSCTSPQSTGKLHAELILPIFILLSYEHCHAHHLGQPKGHTPKLRDWWEQCISSDVTGSTGLILDNKRQTHIYTHSSSPGAGFTLYTSEIMVRSSSKLSRIKTHRTNITSIDFYLGFFLTIFHKSILLRNPLCPLNIAKNVTVESFWHVLFPNLPNTLMCLKRSPQGTRTQTLMGTLEAAFVKCHYFISQTPTNSLSPLGSISSLWCLVGWTPISDQVFVAT